MKLLHLLPTVDPRGGGPMEGVRQRGLRLLEMGTVIATGGDEYVGAGGASNGTVVNDGALEYVDAGGTATNTTMNGGFDFVAAGGTATGTKVHDGELLVKGVANDTKLSGGNEYVYAGGIQNNVNFEGSSAATLYLEDPSGLTGTVSNFEAGDTIDFLGTSFTSVNFDGSTLTLATGSATYTYQFHGTENDTALTVASDGHGGTAISLAKLSELSASLAPGSGPDGTISPQDTTSANPALVNAQT